MNPSFEETDCDVETNQFWYPSLNWYNANNSSPDYYSTSLSPGECFNLEITGGQTPRTGTFMAGLWGSKVESPSRDYIQSRLINSLEEDSVYCLEMFVLLAEFCPLAINRFGVQLSADSLYDFSTSQLLLGGVLFSSPVEGFLANTENWMQLSWEYQAMGGEEFITLGNFWSESDLEYMNVEGSDSFPLAYYYVDDVSITSCSVNSVSEEDIFTFIGPNPVDDRLVISAGSRPIRWEIYTVDGRVIRSGMLTENGVIELSNLSSAMYVIRLSDDEGRMQSRLICKQ